VPLALLVASVAAGCGAAHTAGTATPKLPRALAGAWAARADAIAAAASAGRGCSAQTLADSLRDDVVGADTRVPTAFRSALLVSVNRLADSITCTHTRTVTAPASKPPKPPPHDDHPKPPRPGPKGKDH
jgi:hypothetical protein